MGYSLKKFVINNFPILEWAKFYNLETGIGDFIAGVTIALTLIPQSVAFAMLAGVEPQYGLYASVAGNFVYAVMGTCPQISIGPTALLSLASFTYTGGHHVDLAIFLCFFGGFVQVLAGCLRFGFLVNFISQPVISGYTSAAAIMVTTSQIKTLLGCKFSSTSFFDTWIKVYKNIHKFRINDTALSVVCITTLIAMDKLKTVKINLGNDDKSKEKATKIKKVLWYVSLGRNALVIMITTFVAREIYKDAKNPLILTGPIASGLPKPQLPPFETKLQGTTYNTIDMMRLISTGLLAVPVIGIISSIAIAKAYAKRKRVRASHEIVTLGVCNIVSSFFQSITVGGSLSRSAIYDASGVKTPAAGLISGFLVMMTLVVLTPYFFFIPKATLASVNVAAVIKMINISIVKKLWKISRIDVIPLIIAFFFTLAFGLLVGLFCGVLVDGILLIFYNFRPYLEVTFVNNGHQLPHYAIRPIGGLHYVGAENTRSNLKSLLIHGNDNNFKEETQNNNKNIKKLPKEAQSNDESIKSNPPKEMPKILVIYCENLYRMDYTFLQNMKSLIIEWPQDGRIIWCNLRPDIKTKLERVAPFAIVCDSKGLNTYLSNSLTTET